MKKLLSNLEAIVVAVITIVTIVTFTAVVNSKATKTNTITTLDERVAVAIDTDDTQSFSDFVNRALRFYIGFLNTKKAETYLQKRNQNLKHSREKSMLS